MKSTKNVAVYACPSSSVSRGHRSTWRSIKNTRHISRYRNNDTVFFFEKDLFSELKYRPRKEVTDNSIMQNGCEDFVKTTSGPSCFPQVRGWIHEGSISAEKLPTQEKFTKIPVVNSPEIQL